MPEGSASTFRPLENKFMVVAAVLAFLLALVLSNGSLFVALGALGLIAGFGWVALRLLRPAPA